MSGTVLSHGEPLSAEALIASPRGRALVFAYVQNSVAVSLPAGRDELVESLRTVPLPEPTWQRLRSAMGCVVGGAMYWQPPHAEDLLCEDPAVKTALMPIAELLTESGVLDSWSGPIAVEDQWDIQWFDDARHRERAVTDDLAGPSSAQRLAKWQGQVIATEVEHRLEALKNPGDPAGGEWWSAPPPRLWSTSEMWPDGTPVGLWLVEDDFGQVDARARRLSIRSDSRIVEIDSPEDWSRLCRRHPLDVTLQRHGTWSDATGRNGQWVIPDWSTVAQDHDGVRVTVAGYLRTAGRVIEVDSDRASLMAGWNPGQTFWLNDVVRDVAEVVDWSFDDATDEWRRTSVT
ncbi:hypothetical protein DFO66_12137 [Brevibacterium sanguinis]|uniref:Uncharacterized protein n=2 Tax=Brevibacterium TaxID=1696 RepID=A0A366IF52_9MICO|nr:MULTISPECIES: hypothetical protein [Brevibacterium]RBP61503.1 hypothetical protein DFO66_12137 [Brevibacterium sanguinis]RBP68597.1 hypothetical protein DFO65_11721 [Brevibacterium celere]